MPHIAVIVGSLRRESINRKLAQALARLAGSQCRFDLLELGDIPLYNEDLFDPEPPAPVQRMKAAVTEADAVLFVTPEYNRSFTPAVKNVLDWGSRPYGKSCWPGKPAAIVGASPGAIGTAVAQSHLRHVLVGLGMALMGQPEIYLTFKPDMIDAEHNVVDDRTRQLLGNHLAAFLAWIERHRPG
ncbi:MAG TPA: NADPH-dependent FMN reductase [Geminicoccus sp.]|uniref:NADPH-dependent FMN reductase n=1 Tax=Geminicoccus sp. TaxID=2024832 RepID=UPI002BB834CA|nr:NADPH-dependent FMN reductase [Geminicoccus sp.]HWL72065.1 NADPH-dependent FMN reductase [Geminicoccus sp.]